MEYINCNADIHVWIVFIFKYIMLKPCFTTIIHFHIAITFPNGRYFQYINAEAGSFTGCGAIKLLKRWVVNKSIIVCNTGCGPSAKTAPLNKHFTSKLQLGRALLENGAGICRFVKVPDPDFSFLRTTVNIIISAEVILFKKENQEHLSMELTRVMEHIKIMEVENAKKEFIMNNFIPPEESQKIDLCLEYNEKDNNYYINKIEAIKNN